MKLYMFNSNKYLLAGILHMDFPIYKFSLGLIFSESDSK